MPETLPPPFPRRLRALIFPALAGLSVAVAALMGACSPSPPAAPPAAPSAHQPAAAAAASPARIVPTANPNSVAPNDRGTAANTADAMQAIRALSGDPQALLEAYRQGASRATTLDLTPFGITPASVIADIGSGTGALPVRLLVEGTPFARLYAVETDASSLDVLGAALEVLPDSERVERVHSRLDDASLPPASVDRVIVIDTGVGCLPTADSGVALPPMRVQAGERMLASIRSAVTPDAQVHVLRPWNALPVPPRRCPKEWVVHAFDQAGFRLLDDHPQTPPEGADTRHQAFHLVFAPAG